VIECLWSLVLSKSVRNKCPVFSGTAGRHGNLFAYLNRVVIIGSRGVGKRIWRQDEGCKSDVKNLRKREGRTSLCLHPSSRLATIKIDRKLGSCAPAFWGTVGPHLTQCDRGKLCLFAKFHLDSSNVSPKRTNITDRQRDTTDRRTEKHILRNFEFKPFHKRSSKNHRIAGRTAESRWYIWPRNGLLASDPREVFWGGGKGRTSLLMPQAPKELPAALHRLMTDRETERHKTTAYTAL